MARMKQGRARGRLCRPIQDPARGDRGVMWPPLPKPLRLRLLHCPCEGPLGDQWPRPLPMQLRLLPHCPSGGLWGGVRWRGQGGGAARAMAWRPLDAAPGGRGEGLLQAAPGGSSPGSQGGEAPGLGGGRAQRPPHGDGFVLHPATRGPAHPGYPMCRGRRAGDAVGCTLPCCCPAEQRQWGPWAKSKHRAQHLGPGRAQPQRRACLLSPASSPPSCCAASMA